jgi:hypothetical protein
LYFYLGFGPLLALSQKYIPAAPRGINTASKVAVGNCGVTTPHELPQVDEDDDEDKVLVLDEVDFVDELEERSHPAKATRSLNLLKG